MLQHPIQSSTVVIPHLVNAHLPTPVLALQLSVSILFFQCVRRFICQLIQLVKVTTLECSFDFIRANVFDHLFQGIIAQAVELVPFCLIRRLHSLTFRFQIGQLHCRVFLQALGKLCPVGAARLFNSKAL